MSLRRRRRVGVVVALVAAAVVVGLVPGGAGAVQVDQSTLPSANPIDNTPRVQNGSVYAIARSGNRVVVGGSFTSVQPGGGGTAVTRNRLFSYNHATGQLDSWNPNLGGSVEAVAWSADGQWIYAGGYFTSAGGSSVSRLERWNAATGARDTSFNPTFNSAIRDLDLRGNILYVGGGFTTVNGVTRERLAAVNATTGATLPLNVPLTVGHTDGTTPNVLSLDVTADGRRLVAIGNFRLAGGADRRQLAVVDLDGAGGGAVSPNWRSAFFAATCNPVFDTYMRDVDISPDGRWFVVVTTGSWRGATGPCDVAARFQLDVTGNDVRPLWTSYTGGDTLLGVGVTSEAVYVGGHQRWGNNSTPPRGDNAGPGAVTREGIAALDPASGVPLTWNPGRQRGVGCEEITTSADALYIGHDTNIVAGETRPRLTGFPMTGESTPDPQAIPLPATLFQGRTDGSLRRATLSGSGVSGVGAGPGGVNWSQLRGGFVQHGQLYAWNLGGTAFTRRSFDGTTVGAPTDLIAAAGYVVGPPTNLTTVRAAAYADGRIYYLRSGSTRMFWRWFSLQSGIVGASEFTASTANWSSVTGIEAAGGALYGTRTDGRLYRYSLSGTGSVGSTATLVDSSNNWNSGNDLFMIPVAAGAFAGAAAATEPADVPTTTTAPTTTTTTATEPTTTTSTSTPPAAATAPTTTAAPATTAPATTAAPATTVSPSPARRGARGR